MAKTLTTYYSNDKDILSFKTNVDVKVFSKGAGKRPDLWGVEVRFIIIYIKLSLSFISRRAEKFKKNVTPI